MFLAIGCSSVATAGARGGGGGGKGVHGGSDGEGGVQQWGGGNSAVGGGVGAIGGVQQWGCRQPLRTALHNISIKSPKQFELKQS